MSQLHGKLAALVRISSDNESCENAIQSVIRCAKHFSEIHIEQYGWSTDRELYPDWDRDKRALTENHIKILFHTELNVDKILQTALVDLPPHVILKEGILQTTLEQMATSAYTHYGIETVTLARSPGKDVIIEGAESLFYGFLTVILMLDWWRRRWNLGRFRTNHDVRITLLYKTYGRQVLAPKHVWWRLWNTGEHTSNYGGEAAVIYPSKDMSPLEYILHVLKQHSHLRLFGTWWLWLFIYTLLFALPYWNPFVFDSRYLVLFYKPLIHPVFLTLMAAHAVLVLLVVKTYMDVPLRFINVLLFPIYLAAFPFLLVYSKFHQRSKSWRVD